MNDPTAPRIVMLTCEFGPVRAGGLGAMLTSLCDAIDRRRFAPVVVLPRSGHAPSWSPRRRVELRYATAEAYDVAGLEVWLVSNPLLDGAIYPEPFDHAGIKKTDEFGERVADLLGHLGGDLLHLHDAYGYKALYRARQLGLPTIFTVHRLHEDEPPLAFAELATLHLADHVTTVSHGYLRERGDFFAQRPGVTVVPNGIDLRFWDVEQLGERAAWHPPDDGAPGHQAHRADPADPGRDRRRCALLARLDLRDRATAAFVGRLDRDQKGVDVLLEAWSAVPRDASLNLLIVGEGDRELTAQVAALATTQPDRVRVINRLVSHHEVRELFGAVDAALVPSRYEPFGLVLLEAMAMGALPIAAAVGGLRDVLADAGVGSCVPGGDASALAAALRGLADWRAQPADELERQRRAARDHARRYSATAMARGYEQLYGEVLADGAARRAS